MNLKIYNLHISTTIDSLFSLLSSDQYNDENTKGFLIDKYINGSIFGRFIYKKTFDLVTKDPFGNELVNEQVSFDIVNFIIDGIKHLLIVNDAPRSLKMFFSSLSVSSGYKVAIDQLKVDLLGLYHFIASKSQGITLNCIEIDKLQIASNVNARITLSGGDDIEQYINAVTYNKMKYEVRLIKLLPHINSIDMPLMITNTCQVKGLTNRMNELIQTKFLELFSEYIIGEGRQ